MLSVLASPRVSLKNIVVATDFSPASEFALDHAISIARRYESKILLVHAMEASSRPQPGQEADMHSREGALADAERKLLAEAQKVADIECERRLLVGTTLEVVDQILALDHIDLIVVGTHGTRGFRKLLIGSAADRIFHHVRCPVLVIGPSVHKEKAAWNPRRIMLATDLQSDESRAVEYATTLAAKHNARLALLHVTMPAGPPYPQDSELVITPYFESRLRELISYRPRGDYPAETWVEFHDDPVAGIIGVAHRQAIDLLILSVHPKQPWTSHFTHNAHRIVAEAPCPALIVQREL
jgi:nucleotide-binding universal stress UspA family protein